MGYRFFLTHKAPIGFPDGYSTLLDKGSGASFSSGSYFGNRGSLSCLTLVGLSFVPLFFGELLNEDYLTVA